MLHQDPNIDVTHSEGIARITFSNLKQHNALTGDLLSRLAETLTEASEHQETRLVLLQSAGEGSFCAGASFDELLKVETLEQAKTFFSGFAQVINAMRTCSKFVVLRVHGKAIGGGVGIAAAADCCLASTQASIKLSELSIGIAPFVIEPAVSRKIGLAATNQLALHANTFYDAQWAFQHGLYDHLYDTLADLDLAIDKRLAELASYSPQACQAFKQVMWQNTQHWQTLLYERAEQSAALALSTHTQTILKAFKQKNKS